VLIPVPSKYRQPHHQEASEADDLTGLVVVNTLAYSSLVENHPFGGKAISRELSFI